jgi:hypothetical protein
MSNNEVTLRIDASDVRIISAALELLLGERSRALKLAAEIARGKGEAMPDQEDFGLTTILRLSRRCALDQCVTAGPAQAALSGRQAGNAVLAASDAG